MHDFGLLELPRAWPGSGEPKLHYFGSPELPGARPGSGDLKIHDSGSPALPGARPSCGETNNVLFRFTGAASSLAWLR